MLKRFFHKRKINRILKDRIKKYMLRWSIKVHKIEIWHGPRIQVTLHLSDTLIPSHTGFEIYLGKVIMHPVDISVHKIYAPID